MELIKQVGILIISIILPITATITSISLMFFIGQFDLPMVVFIALTALSGIVIFSLLDVENFFTLE